ncbi:unnamed protein product [Durusdinium trenchii]|uniref:Ankyrin repeat protein n=1 Tax=Durusdinium trenchii TaxID=1381693 RepID=A0ABP0NKN2_9DINO
MTAAEHGDLEVVRLLLEAGADKNATTTDWSTALMRAAELGHLEVVRLLLKAGADGATALIDAAEYDQLEVVRLLLEAGADKNAATIAGETALMGAAKYGWTLGSGALVVGGWGGPECCNHCWGNSLDARS